MSHLVAGYPTDDIEFTAAKALVDGGADILEVQLPFSDPSADGPAIQSACTKVLSRGYKTKDGLAFIEKLHKNFPDVNLYNELRFTYLHTWNKRILQKSSDRRCNWNDYSRPSI